MGFPGFAKIFRYGILAAIALAAAIIAAIALATPAAAKGGGGGDGTLYRWDTDNLNYSGRGAVAFNIPFHKYGGYSVAACQKNVADSFFQTDNSVVNDFPRLVPSGSANNVTWSLAAGAAGNNAGCDTFAAQQDRLAGQIAAGVGYALDESGNLAAAPSGAAYTTGRSVADLSYVAWTAKAASGYTVTKTDNYQPLNNIGATSDPSYLRRVDGLQPPDGNRRAISPSTATWTVPSVSSSNTGNFGQRWHGTRLVTTITTPGYFTDGSGHYECSGTQIGNTCYGTSTWVWDVPQTYVPESTVNRTSGVRVSAAGNVSRHLTAAKSADLCPSLFHPRGEDSASRIGSQTGRTLTSLSHNLGKVADRFWCRSDLRYARRFAAEHHTGVTEAQRHPQARNIAVGTVFSAYGRLGCYYTTTGQKLITSSAAYECGYKFPLPRCDSDKDGTADREYTAAEIQALVDRGTIADGSPFTIAENARCAPAAAPPTQAGFTADPCVTASLEIYENRTAGSDAEPGVPASDRTLAVATGRTAWDLDIASPHPLTASPPRDTTAGTGDPDGCADGSESRADHAASSGSAARSQSTAPSYASSARTDSAAPPNDADGDIDYTGAVKNMAHRYASRVAENTCAAKLAEAEAELSLLELREDDFAQWLSDYKTAADTNASRYASYRRTSQQSGAGLAVLRFNDIEANKATYAALLATRYTNLSSALAAAKTAYDTATDRTAGNSRAAVITTSSNSGCVAHYNREIARLKTLFANAETAAARRIRAAQTAVSQTRLVSAAAIANNDTAVGYRVPDISADLKRTETTRTCADDWNPPFCTRPAAEGEDCGLFGCAGRWTTTTTRYYTCPGGNYSVAGTVFRSYKGTRSASYSTTYTAARRSTESASRTCPSWTSARTSGYSYAAYSDAVAYVMGTPGTASSLPSVASASAPATSRALSKVSVLGSYYLSHGDRANLETTAASDRNTAGNSLSVTTGSVPSGSPQAIADYQTAYKTAYDTAFSQAEGHMSGTAWNNFDWRYHNPSLAWANYQEDTAATFSASTATPRDGTGCDLVNVASDGTVSVEATRLDYETSSYGKGSVFGARTDAQRTCKIRRTRTPELLLEYQPSAPSGTDTSKATTFWHVNYQPSASSERFKLYGEAEVFAVKASLGDSPPVFCSANIPAASYVSHAAGSMNSMSAAVAVGTLRRPATDVVSPAGYTGSPPDSHCFSGRFPGYTAEPAKISVFDDTAHSAMNLVYMEEDPGDTSGIDLLASGAAFTVSAVSAYPGDSAQSGSFYGVWYSAPTALGSTSGWDVLGDNNPTTTLASKIKNRIIARDKPAVSNLPAVPADTAFKYVSQMNFDIGFLDCRPDIENVVFIGNITSATADSNQANGYAVITSSGGYPMDAPLWYYPAWNEIKNKTRTDGSIVAVGERSGIYTHPQSARYGWVMETTNHISVDKQPISAFRNFPDVKHADPNRPQSVSLSEHRRVCFGDRNAMAHYRSASAALPFGDRSRDTTGHISDASPQQAVVVWSAHNPVCDTSDVCGRWQTRCYRNVHTPAEADQYPLTKWGNVLVSTLDRETENEQAVKIAVDIIVQTVRAGREW